MVSSISLPSPPADDIKPSIRKAITTKHLKPTQRSKGSGSAAIVRHDHISHAVGLDGRHKRVWKACERCRMKKTKCDGEFPCKRCKDDGLVCAAGVRKKMEYKQLPKGYAEVLENTQFALIATVHKLYSMVRTGEPWGLGEPELNEHGEPVIHDIAQRLGCIRPNSDIDLPVHSVFPEDSAGMAELARQLEAQQQQQQQQQTYQEPLQQQQQALQLQQQQQQQHHHHQQQRQHQHQHQHHQHQQQRIIKKEAKAISQGNRSQVSSSHMYAHTDRASSSELDHSDIEINYRRATFGSQSTSSNPLALSPQSLAGSIDFDFATASTTPLEMAPSSAGLFPTQSPLMGSLSDWAVGKVGPAPPSTQQQQQQQQQQHHSSHSHNHQHQHHHHQQSQQQQDEIALHLLRQPGIMQQMDAMNRALDPAEFGIIKPNMLSACGNPGLMMGMADPTIYTGYEDEMMGL